MSPPITGPRVVLLRHAERPPLPEGEPGNEVALSPAGREAARALGRSLDERIAVVVSSPIERCVETAACILAGAGATTPIGRSRVLGDPGPFVRDPEVAWNAWLELGPEEMLTRLILGRVDRPGFVARTEGAAIIAAMVEDTLRGLAAHEIALLVTHDGVLGPATACWCEDRPGTRAVPSFLEAATCWSLQGRLMVEWRGLVTPIATRSTRVPR